MSRLPRSSCGGERDELRQARVERIPRRLALHPRATRSAEYCTPRDDAIEPVAEGVGIAVRQAAAGPRDLASRHRVVRAHDDRRADLPGLEEHDAETLE